MKVCLCFEGHLVVDIDADPEDADAWPVAVGNAWANASAEDIGSAAELVTDEILPQEQEGAEQ